MYRCEISWDHVAVWRKQCVKFISSFLWRLMKKGKIMELGFSIFQNTVTDFFFFLPGPMTVKCK